MANRYQFSDFDIDFNKNAFTSDVSIKKDKNSIQQSIKNIILTMPGEKPFNRDFGLGIHSYMFETFTALDEALLRGDIELALANWEPRIQLDNVRVISDKIDSNEVTIHISYFSLLQNNAIPVHDSMTLSLTKAR